MGAAPPSHRKHRWHRSRLIVLAVVAAAMIGVHLMFFFWPFRYREVHPLLEQVFRSRVMVGHYHRTYFPYPGFVADGVTFYRHGDMRIPPLATIARMRVMGTWTNLFLHPHRLHEMLLEGVHVQIPPPGTKARGMDFDQGVIDTSQSKLQIETIVADATTLDFLRRGEGPLRFLFASLRVQNVQQNRPMRFATQVQIPGPRGTVAASGTLGPFRSSHYATTALEGMYSLAGADLSHVDHVAGHVAARGRFGGNFSAVDVKGQAAIPDFRVGSAHTVALDAAYHVIVNGTRGDVEIQNVQVKSGPDVITASGSVAGSPKKVAVTIATENSRVDQLLDMVEGSTPEVAGEVSFRAAVDFEEGPGPFLQRLHLQGTISLEKMRFVAASTQEKMDAFSARVRRDPPGEPQHDAKDDLLQVQAEASSQTTFAHGMAYFPNIQVTLPGAKARLHGTFNLLNTRIHLTGKVALQRSLSHAVTGWKAWLLKPLAPFFRHRDAGAVVSIAVTGTAQQPKIREDLLHDK
jgi:hypothetical protein